MNYIPKFVERFSTKLGPFSCCGNCGLINGKVAVAPAPTSSGDDSSDDKCVGGTFLTVTGGRNLDRWFGV